jgi:tripartite-type tricarboxylate transporter receptor subunit TctC
LAVTTATRFDMLPDVPAIAEFLPGTKRPRGTVLSRPGTRPPKSWTSSTTRPGLADPNMKAQLANLGATALVGSPADFGQLIVEETEKWAKVVRFTGINAE